MINKNWNIFKIIIISLAVATEVDSYRIIALPFPDKVPINFRMNQKSNISYYDIGLQRVSTTMDPREMLAKIMKTKTIEFTIDNVNYTIYPLSKILRTKNNETKCIGRFYKASANFQNATFVFKNGDKALDDSRYSSTIQFFPNQTFSAKKFYSDSVGHLKFRVNTPDLFKTYTTKLIGFYAGELGRAATQTVEFIEQEIPVMTTIFSKENNKMTIKIDGSFLLGKNVRASENAPKITKKKVVNVKTPETETVVFNDTSSMNRTENNGFMNNFNETEREENKNKEVPADNEQKDEPAQVRDNL